MIMVKLKVSIKLEIFNIQNEALPHSVRMFSFLGRHFHLIFCLIREGKFLCRHLPTIK